MTQILAAIDGSRQSERVLEEAAMLAKTMSAKLLLVYVVATPAIPEGYERYVKFESPNPALGATAGDSQRRLSRTSNTDGDGLSAGYESYAKTEGLDPMRYMDLIGDKIVQTVGSKIKDLEFEEVVEHGSPAERIVSTAEARGVDMIVVGLIGLHGIGRLKALGSVSRRVIENSKVPVVVVP